MTLKKRIIRNIAAGAFGRGITAIGPILVLPCYLKAWGPNLYSEWLLLTSIPACVMLAPDFGIAGVATNRIANLTGEGKSGEAQTLYNSVFWILLGCCALLGVIGTAISAFVPWASVFSLRLIDRQVIPAIILLLALQLACQQLMTFIFGAYRCGLQNARAAFLFGAFALAESVSVIVVLCFRFSPLGVAGILLTIKFVAFCIVMFDAARLKGVPRVKFETPNPRLLAPLLLPALGHGGMPLLHLAQNQGLLTLIGLSAGIPSIAVFQSIRTMTNGVRSVFGILAFAVLAELPHALGTGDSAQIGRLLRRVRSIGLIVAICALVGTIVVGRPIFTIWTNGAIEYNSNVAILLAGSLFPFFWATPASIYLHAANRLHTMLPISLIFIALSLALTWPLGHSIGVVAAAIVTVLWECMNAVVLTTFFRRSSLEIWRCYTA